MRGQSPFSVLRCDSHSFHIRTVILLVSQHLSAHVSHHIHSVARGSISQWAIVDIVVVNFLTCPNMAKDFGLD